MMKNPSSVFVNSINEKNQSCFLFRVSLLENHSSVNLNPALGSNFEKKQQTNLFFQRPEGHDEHRELNCEKSN